MQITAAAARGAQGGRQAEQLMPDIFIESPRFDGCPSAGFTSEPEYRVVITRRASGVEKRNRAWTYPLVRLTLTIGPREEGEIQNALEWWHSSGGGRHRLPRQGLFGLPVLRCGQTPTANDQPLLATDVGGTYQLNKRYQVGIDQDSNPVYQDRPIYKPVVGHGAALGRRLGRLHDGPRDGQRGRHGRL